MDEKSALTGHWLAQHKDLCLCISQEKRDDMLLAVYIYVQHPSISILFLYPPSSFHIYIWTVTFQLLPLPPQEQRDWADGPESHPRHLPSVPSLLGATGSITNCLAAASTSMQQVPSCKHRHPHTLAPFLDYTGRGRITQWLRIQTLGARILGSHFSSTIYLLTDDIGLVT